MSENNLLYHDETSQKYVKRSTRYITNLFIQNIIEEIKELNPKSILDVGCGTGYTTHLISEAVQADILGCDLDEKRVNFAKIKYNQDVIIADITHLPFKNRSFDLVLAMEIIEHLPDPEKALSELERVCRDNIIITVPNDPYFMLANFMRGKNLKRWGNPPDHIRHFNKRSLEKYLSKQFPSVAVKKNALLWLMAVARMK